MNTFEKEYLKILRESEENNNPEDLNKKCKEMPENTECTECTECTENLQEEECNCSSPEDGSVQAEGKEYFGDDDEEDDDEYEEDDEYEDDYEEDDEYEDDYEEANDVVQPNEWLVDGICVKCNDPECDGSCECPKCGSPNCMGDCDGQQLDESVKRIIHKRNIVK